MQGEFTCNCGATVAHDSKSISDRKHGVLRCHACYDIWHKAEVVKKNKRKKATMIDRLCLQEKERKAKAAKALEGV